MPAPYRNSKVEKLRNNVVAVLRSLDMTRFPGMLAPEDDIVEIWRRLANGAIPVKLLYQPRDIWSAAYPDSCVGVSITGGVPVDQNGGRSGIPPYPAEIGWLGSQPMSLNILIGVKTNVQIENIESINAGDSIAEAVGWFRGCDIGTGLGQGAIFCYLLGFDDIPHPDRDIPERGSSGPALRIDHYATTVIDI